MGRLETDYLVVGAGVSGMGFTDSLVSSGDGDVLLVDRRPAPGGHWLDAYPFVRLHLPSAYYGVASRPLGADQLDRDGPNAGWYELATGEEICAYYEQVLTEQLLPTGRVRFLGSTEHRGDASGEHVLRSQVTGEVYTVTVRRKVVDATYLETSVPATHTPSFAVDEGVRVVPVNGLVEVDARSGPFVVLGAGKTAMDACLWLLRNGADPDRIRWVRPRDAWLFDRAQWQPLDQVASVIEGVAGELEALARAESVTDLFRRLEACGRFVRLDPAVTPTMFRCATVSAHELGELRSIGDVIRLGRVRRLHRGRIALDGGDVATDPAAVHVDCTARALRSRPPRPVFEPGRITLQQVQYCTPSLNAALIGYVEATRHDEVEQNRLCPPNPYPERPEDWLRMLAVTMAAARLWSKEPDLDAWVRGTRLNLARGLGEHAGEPRTQAALARYLESVRPGVARLQELVATG